MALTMCQATEQQHAPNQLRHEQGALRPPTCSCASLSRLDDSLKVSCSTLALSACGRWISRCGAFSSAQLVGFNDSSTALPIRAAAHRHTATHPAHLRLAGRVASSRRRCLQLLDAGLAGLERQLAVLERSLQLCTNQGRAETARRY